MSATTAGKSWFATTHWSVVLSAGRGDGATSQLALEQLCEHYWVPLYSYVRRRGYPRDDAQDLTQEFFARLVEQNRMARADQQKGRFRSFLLTTLKNFLADDWDKRRAQKGVAIFGSCRCSSTRARPSTNGSRSKTSPLSRSSNAGGR